MGGEHRTAGGGGRGAGPAGSPDTRRGRRAARPAQRPPPGPGTGTTNPEPRPRGAGTGCPENDWRKAGSGREGAWSEAPEFVSDRTLEERGGVRLQLDCSKKDLGETTDRLFGEPSPPPASLMKMQHPLPFLLYIKQVQVSNYLFIQQTFHSEMSVAQ